MGKVEGEVCAEAGKGRLQEDRGSPSHERSRQDEVVGVDESPLGGEEGERIVLACAAYQGSDQQCLPHHPVNTQAARRAAGLHFLSLRLPRERAR